MAGMIYFLCTILCKRSSLSQAIGIFKNNIDGDIKGDGLRLGGTFVIKDGQLVFSHVMETADDHVDVTTILKSLDIKSTVPLKIITQQPRIVCNDEICKLTN